jgi:hypothetical protein
VGIGRLFGRKRHQRSHLVWDVTMLAKQVLSQLSYTPTDGTCIDFKAFATVRKLPEASAATVRFQAL